MSVYNYIDTFKIKKSTTKEHRVRIRRSLNRNENMKHALKRQRNKCFFCGEPIDMSGHLDHLNPVYYGGDNHKLNNVATCRGCNLAKGTDQLIITNQDTISVYERIKKAHRIWVVDKRKGLNPKKTEDVHRYYLYRADLFRGRQL